MVGVSEQVPPFQAFLDANTRTVYRFLLAAVGPQDADDCFQETFLSALRAYPRLRDGSALDRWVLRIASRKAIDHHRAGGRRPEPVREPREDAVFDADPFDEILAKAVADLPAKQRVAVVLRHVLDRPYDEVARLMETTEDAARANVSAGVRRLRELIT